MKFDLVGLLAIDAPKHWHDANGKQWRTPNIKGRLKFKSLGYRALRDFVLARDGYRCRYCGFQFPEGQRVIAVPLGGYMEERIDRLVADHIISRENGGAHHPLNLVAACERCNATKATTVDARVPS